MNVYGHLITKSRQFNPYADDIVILGCNKNAVRETFMELEEQKEIWVVSKPV